MNKKLLQIIKQGENETTEFKTSFSDEVIVSLVAFANAKGGSVFIGVDDNGILKGVHLQTESVQNWINEIKTKTAPPLIPDAEVLDYKNQKILVFYIQEYPIKPVSFRGRYYKRVANANQLMNVNEVVNTHLQTVNTSWDYHTNNHTFIRNFSNLGIKSSGTLYFRAFKFMFSEKK